MGQTEKLKAELDDAKAAFHKALTVMEAAEAAYRDAWYSDTGLHHHIVEITSGWRAGKRFYVTRAAFGFSRIRLQGWLLNKDGTPGRRPAFADLSDVRDLGLYKPKDEA